MINRRDFIQSLALTAIALKYLSPGMLPRAYAQEPISPRITLPEGQIYAAVSFDKEKIGYSAGLARFDLRQRTAKHDYFDLTAPHDAIMLNPGRHIVLSNNKSPHAVLVGKDQDQREIELPEQMVFTGHGIFERETGSVIASAAKKEDGKRKGFFVRIDSQDGTIRDIVPTKLVFPHDMILLDDSTYAVCDYNLGLKDAYEDNSSGISSKIEGDHSYVQLYDKHTLKFVDKIAVNNMALTTHLTKGGENRIFAIGSQEYKIKDIQELKNAFLMDDLKTYMTEANPEYKELWPQFFAALQPHYYEDRYKEIGLPLSVASIDMKDHSIKKIYQDPHIFRRAQSVCYNNQTNTVCISYPHTDSVCCIDGATGAIHPLLYKDLGLSEIRALTAVDNTPYVIIAGIRQGLCIYDTASHKIIEKFEDVRMGRIVHMHYSHEKT